MIGADEDILELNNGCICCTVRADLTRAVSSLLQSGRRIDHIMIETAGIADPAPVIQSFILDEVLRTATELNALGTVCGPATSLPAPRLSVIRAITLRVPAG